MTSQVSRYHGDRFPPEIISYAVWLSSIWAQLPRYRRPTRPAGIMVSSEWFERQNLQDQKIRCALHRTSPTRLLRRPIYNPGLHSEP